MSITSAASGPHGDLVHVDGRARERTSSRARRRRSRRSRSAGPSAVSRVPSSGSTATSTAGPCPLPTSSPLKSIGASSFSPSPITTTPSIATVSSTARIASTAAWSAALLVAAADPAAGRHRRRLGHADELEREVSVRTVTRRPCRARQIRASHGGILNALAIEARRRPAHRPPPARSLAIDRLVDAAVVRAELGRGSVSSLYRLGIELGRVLDLVLRPVDEDRSRCPGSMPIDRPGRQARTFLPKIQMPRVDHDEAGADVVARSRRPCRCRRREPRPRNRSKSLREHRIAVTSTDRSASVSMR